MRATRLFLGLSLALAFGACGDDDETLTDGGTDAAADVSTEDANTEDGGDEEDAETSNTIVDIAAGNENFSTLVAALQRTGLDAALAGEGPFTVFAPTDEAFEDLGLDLSTLTDEQLTTVLQYHVVSGAVTSDALPQTADTLANLTLWIDASGPTINDAGVAMADITADNGVIHVIDKVLVPADIIDMAGFAGLTGLAGALTAAELIEPLEGDGPFTVFAPTNAAFEALDPAPEGEALTQALLYHVISGAAVPAAEVPARANTMATNEWENNLTLLIDSSEGVAVNGVNVVIADIRTVNGIIHVVESVIVPPNIVDVATLAGFTELTGAVGAAAEIEAGVTVAAALTGDGPLTVFAPTNAAFEAISDTVDGLTAEQVRDVLLYHVVGGDAPALSSDLADGEVDSLLAGQTITVDTTAGTVEGAELNADLLDINVTNGVVHVVNGVLIPPSFVAE